MSRSPVYARVAETLDGRAVVNAFGLRAVWLDDLNSRIDANQRVVLARQSCNRWLGVRLDFIGSSLVLFAALLAVFARDELGAGFVALSVTYSLQWSGILTQLVRLFAETEVSFNAMERIDRYSKLESERQFMGAAPAAVDDAWPSRGDVEFRRVSFRYRESLPLVLKSLSLKIKGGERVAVCGASGCGK